MVGADEIEAKEVTTQTTQEDVEPEEKEKPDLIVLLLKTTIDTILLEEVTTVGTKMNNYRRVLAQAILEFAEGHQDDVADLSRLVNAFRAGWKVYREQQDEKGAVDVFMKEMNNTLWVPEDSG